MRPPPPPPCLLCISMSSDKNHLSIHRLHLPISPAAPQGQQEAVSRLYFARKAVRLFIFFCSEFYAIVRNKRSKYEDEDFIPMDAIHTTHKVTTAAVLC